MKELISKADVLLEALPYIQKFNHATFVIKYGGSFMDSPDPAVRTGVARDIVFLEAVEITRSSSTAAARQLPAPWKKRG